MRFLSLALLLLVAPAASAQFAIGGQIGDPTGLSLKFGGGPGALLVAVGWDLDGFDRVAAEGHYVLRTRPLQGTRTARLFYGPGVFVHAREEAEDDIGVSLGVGLEGDLSPDFELYGLLSPRLQLVDETDFDLGGGLGLRLRL
ncbi:MAG: hypothetical protein AAF845_11325 [Bacteroidota bacterium]